MSFDINQYFNCNYGPCDELNRLLNTPNPYSALTQQYIDCLPDPTPFPCSAITHCTSGGTGTDTYVTGGTVSVPATDNTNSGSIGLFYKNSDGTPRTLPFEDTYTTGSTYDNGTALATFTKNDGTTYTLDLSTIDVNNTFVTGFTYNDANTFTISRNDGVDISTSINIVTGLTVNGTLVVDTISATTYTGLTLNDLDDVTTGIPTTPDNTYQGRVLYFDVDTNEWLSTEEYVSTGTVTIWGKKGSAGTIAKGLPVYIVGFDDDIHEVELANSSTGDTMPVIGFTGEQFDNTNTRPLVTFGKLTGLDTTSTVSTLNPNGETWVVNDVLYMSTTTGGLTKFRPIGTNTQIQRIAKILKVGATDGQIFIFNTARTAGLPNLTSDYLWVGNVNDTPQEVIKTDVGITTTGFTYNNNNTLFITDDNGGTLTTTINQMSGLTINGTLSATTIDGSTILSGGTNLTTIIESLDTYVTGTTLSGDKSYTTRNDSEQVLILSGGTNITLSNPSTNLIQISTDDNIITPISIINNSGYIDRPTGGLEYIGSRLGGFTTSPWDVDKGRWDVSLINCGVPFPNTIKSSVLKAFNLCGDVYVEGHPATVVVTIIVYTFECSSGSNKPALTQLGLTSFEVETGSPGTAECWGIDVNTGENVINECETNLLISFQIGEEDRCDYIKFSYKGTIEKIS